jgi:electron transfer flavoprotein alpha subunit
VKLGASLLSGIHTLPQSGKAQRVVYSNKGIQTVSATRSTVVYTLKANAFQPEEAPGAGSIAPFSFAGAPINGYKVLETKKFSDTISLTEAEVVVSAGRGMKGPENWGMIEELAGLLGAATACSKPVADIHWRPHHEHVGQTGIQIAPNVYIAVGISGAIQHLAGVSASKTIIVINKDPEAPFFKAADYGVVGDAFEVLPKLLDAVKAYKAAH